LPGTFWKGPRNTPYAASSGSDFVSRAEFAPEIFTISAHYGGPSSRIRPITTADYPTLANRPSNSRLDCMKLETIHGVKIPSWKAPLGFCVERLVVEMQESDIF